jgi:CRP-like cAMP-binding protein
MRTRRRPVSSLAVSRPPPGRKTPSANRLLAALPADDYARIAPLFDQISLKLKQVIHRAGDPVSHIYFPGSGFCSVLSVLEDGKMVEVATVGREGMIGASAVIRGPAAEPSVTMVQAATPVCYRMTTDEFCNEMNRRGAFSVLLARYAHAYFGFVMQSTACNAVHSIEQRLARWLLTAQDRVDENQFPLTQEFVAMMLGTTRPTVTVVAGTLQRAGLITYRHGHLTIVDREGLENASCECYRVAAGLLDAVTRTPDASSIYRRTASSRD